MEDRRSAEGVEHLQAAARELLGAARAFLDVVEDVVEDSDRLNGAAATLTELFKSGLGGKRAPVWDEAAWEPDPNAGRKRDDGRSTAWFDEPFEVDDPPEEHRGGDTAPDPEAEPGSQDGSASEATPDARERTDPAEQGPGTESAAGKGPAKRAPAKKAAARTPPGKAPAVKAPAGKRATRKAPAKKAGSGRSAKKASEGEAPADGAPVPSRRPTSRVRRIAVD
jgi:hypothetical protein